MIKLLDKATIDKIAAGEVIERPLSVVKELLENSIDADSSIITIEIKEGGLSFIRVTDNGCGITKEDVRTAYLRHATSKIETADDLSGVLSLGFRGEALSTIAAVSQTEMVTKTKDSITGIKYTIHGGTEVDYSEVGVPDGTTIIVRNLFFNTPARKKFLKTPMTEGSYIQDLVLKLALSHPEISFRLISNGQTKLQTSGNGNTKDAIYQLFGRDISSNLIEVNDTWGEIKISGFIGKPFVSRGNRGLENYFINKRYIKSSVINRAIEEAYKTFVMQHKFPFTVLYIDIPPDRIDVNVHPTKMEFKYDNEKELFEAVLRIVRDALYHKEIIPKEETIEKKPADVQKKNNKPAEPYEINRQIKESKITQNSDTPVANSISLSTSINTEHKVMQPKANYGAEKYSPSYKILEELIKSEADSSNSETNNVALNIIKDKGVSYTPAKTEEKPPISHTMSKAMDAYNLSSTKQVSLFDDDFLTDSARKSHRLIGQVFGTYWLIEYDNNLYIMDQHAAHEKVKYEELLANFNSKEIFSQQIMPPMVVTVSYVERQAILDNFDLFIKIGYDIEEFGGNEFKINAVPSNLYGLQEKTVFMEFVNSLIDNTSYMSNDIFIKKLATMACKSAIKGNMLISSQEADALVDQLLKLDNPYTCPHGRPTIISMSEKELEKKFKRII